MRIVAILGLGLSAAGCAGDGDAAPREVDSVARRDSVAAVAASSMSEAQVLGLLDASNAADSALGSLGATRGSTREIKDFGLMITREHHALRREVQQMAANLRLDIAPPSVALDVAPADARQAVDSAPPNAWEQQYLVLAVAQHDASMENLARALAATKSPAVKRYIERAAPIIQKHLDRAKRLQETASRAQPRTR